MPHGAPRHRIVLTALMSLFLLLMQQESARHAIDHIGAQIERARHSALEHPTGEVCVECEMFAAGAAAAPASPPSRFADAPVWIDVAAPVARAAIAVSSFYRSRAPPPILPSA